MDPGARRHEPVDAAGEVVDTDGGPVPTVSGSKATRSAWAPGVDPPATLEPRTSAGCAVRRQTACSSVSTPRSRHQCDEQPGGVVGVAQLAGVRTGVGEAEEEVARRQQELATCSSSSFTIGTVNLVARPSARASSTITSMGCDAASGRQLAERRARRRGRCGPRSRPPPSRRGAGPTGPSRSASARRRQPGRRSGRPARRGAAPSTSVNAAAVANGNGSLERDLHDDGPAGDLRVDVAARRSHPLGGAHRLARLAAVGHDRRPRHRSADALGDRGGLLDVEVGAPGRLEVAGVALAAAARAAHPARRGWPPGSAPDARRRRRGSSSGRTRSRSRPAPIASATSPRIRATSSSVASRSVASSPMT